MNPIHTQPSDKEERSKDKSPNPQQETSSETMAQPREGMVWRDCPPGLTPQEYYLLEPSSGGGFKLKVDQLSFDRANGMTIDRYFTRPDIHPYEQFEWELRQATITNDKGEVVFEQKDVEFPKFWSQLATNVVVSKYFRLDLSKGLQEKSLRNVIDRVAETISQWGYKQGYFVSEEDRDIYCDELKHLLVNQYVAFNSPVWFNVGVEPDPQCSACFINSVDDSMTSIMDLAKTEGMLFKYGSGTGSNLSGLRSSREKLSTGGRASGPVSFMKGYDAFAGVIKSGGKTRRAAKMVILDVSHPDIVDFIECKVNEERKAKALVAAGYDGSFNGEAYSSIFFQNSNNSVRVPDSFMRSVREDGKWFTASVTEGTPMDTYQARDLMRKISESCWECGDPGMQFDTTINNWHTCKNSGRIEASNPCSEYMFLNDSACNLASLNLMKFRTPEGEFDYEAFQKAVDITILAQEIVVDNAAYPRERITINSHKYRPLGLGYANLGALLMSRGLAYDSDEGRNYAAAITALMTGRAYTQSAKIASHVGTFSEYEVNHQPFMDVMRQHQSALDGLDTDYVPTGLLKAAQEAWGNVIKLGTKHGFRNSQVSVLAPTGTIAFMMDCTTTGIEPDFALVKYKNLAGGGMLKIVNTTVPVGLRKLGYRNEQISDIADYIDAHDTIEGAPHLREDHLPVFDCASKPFNGTRFIQPMGHLKMMAAVQPFLSGAISKTVNLPAETTVNDIIDTYTKAWEMGLKAVAIYRDGSKGVQPLSAGEDKEDEKSIAYKPMRRKPPMERESITHKFSIGGHEGYITVGKYDDSTPCELFLVMNKEGSTISGLLDGFATMTSLALQYGVPLETLVQKFSHMRFEPSGFTTNEQIRMAKSLYDYIFRWLALKFLDQEANQAIGNHEPSLSNGDAALLTPPSKKDMDETKPEGSHRFTTANQADAPTCSGCGSMMVRNGSCYVCPVCAATSGCS